MLNIYIYAFYHCLILMFISYHGEEGGLPWAALADVYWIINIILSALLASGNGYVLSYGQV